jgi:hypothetical protein
LAKFSLLTWIANAAAVLAGSRGDVTGRAGQTGCSRQAVYDHARKVRSAVEAEYAGGPTRAQLMTENQQLRHDNIQLWDWLAQTIDFPPAKRDEFAVTAAAMGLSLGQIRGLLTILLGGRAASGRSTLHRTIQAAGRAAGHVLKTLDARCRALVLVGCLDEIFFHHRPVLVGVEPLSMVWFLGTRAEDYQGPTWSRALKPWSALEYVVADAGSGLQAGIAQAQRERRDAGLPVLEGGLDVFHTAKEAHLVLARLWSRVERSWENAEAADRKVGQAERTGREDQQGRRWLECAEAVWSTAESAFREFEAAEAGWRLIWSALQVVRPDGYLNDRKWATERVESASALLPGPEWSKVRGLLSTPPAWTFLDRMHRQLREAEPRDELREELIRLWWLRRQRPRGAGTVLNGGAGHVAHLVQMAACQKRDVHWAESYVRISRVLRQTVRASSAVECLNSVLRMHQARHRTVNQGLLDLKRLYWNSRSFRGGKRRGRCPYEHLGLKLPSYGFWDLLQGHSREGFHKECPD